MSIIRFIFTGDTKKLEAAGDRAERTLGDVRKEMRQGINTSAKYGAAMAAAGAAIAAHLVNNSLKAVDAQAKLARSLNTTVEGLEITTRAAGLSGVALGGVEQATKDLTRRLSQAAGGMGPAVDALDRLHLSAEQLQALPLDQRIATINQAINDFIPAAERAAVAGQLFGEEGSIAMRRIDPETLRQAASDVERFGTALSDVDAAKVEMANDAMSRIGMVVDGLIQRFTVELAPVLEAVAQQFTDAAAEGEKLADGPVKAFDSIVAAAGFVMDALHGLRTVFKGLELIATGFGAAVVSVLELAWTAASKLVDAVIADVNKAITALNKLPKVDIATVDPFSESAFMKGLHEMGDAARNQVAEVRSELHDLAMMEMPSEGLKRFVEESRAAAQEAAEAMVAAQKEAGGLEAPAGGGGGLTDEQREAIAQRLEALRTSYQTELQDLQAKFGEEQEILAEAREAQLISEQEYKARMLEIEQEYQDSVTEVEERGARAREQVAKAEAQARKQALGGMLSELSTLMNSESRKMFEIGKAAAISQTVISTYESAQKSYNALAGIPIVGPALGAAAAAAAIAGGVGRVQSIRSQSFGGGGAPTMSNTQAINGAGTPVGGGAGGGESAPQGPTYTFVGIDPSKMYNGRDIAAALEDYSQNGGKLNLG